MRSLFAIFLLICPFMAGAQTVRGKVVDSEGAGIAFANVVLCRDADSTMVAGCATDTEGTFALECPDREGKHLRVSYVGYETATVRIGTSPITVVLQPAVLDSVVVRGQRELFRQEGGEIVATVKGTFLEKFLTANDVLARMPFVSGADGHFTVFGKGTPLIYINNRLLRDPKELARLSPSDIKSIRVNMMPGAKYDASVGSVIRIVTERPQGEGLGGSLYGKAMRARDWTTEEYAALNYRSKAWDLFGSAYWIQERRKIDMNSYQQLLVGESSHAVTYDEAEKMKSKYLAAVAGINYSPNADHSAGMQYVRNHTAWDVDMSDYIVHTQDGHVENIVQRTRFDNPDGKHHVNAYYSGTPGRRIALDLNADWMTGKDTDRLSSSFADGYAEDVHTVSTRKHDLYAAKGVLSYTDNKRISVEAGAEYAYTEVTQTYRIDEEDIGIDNSNDVMRQNRRAVFVTAKTACGRWGFGAGLRYENIDLDYYRNREYNREQSRSYSKLFPDFQASYSGGKVRVVVGYERKIIYPTYGQLRSNVQYSSPFIYESGNPLLRPQIRHAFTGMFTYRKLRVMSGYTLHEDYITQLMSLYKGRPIVLISTGNVKNVRSGFLAVNYTPEVGFWQPNIEAGGEWQSVDLDDGQDYDKPVFRVRWNNAFSMPGTWLLTLDARWQSEGHSGIYLTGSSWKVDLGVSKQLLDNKLAFSLTFNDIFRSESNWRYVRNDFVDFGYNRRDNPRYTLSVTLRYNFNTTRSKYKGSTSTDEIQRLK